MPERRLIGAQLLQLVLREVRDLEMLALDAFAGEWRKRARQRLDQRGLAGTIAAEQADARVRRDRSSRGRG